MDKFKKRNFIKSRELHGESASIRDDKEIHTQFLTLVYEKIKQYGGDNIYNSDETGLFFKQMPTKTLCTK